MIQEGKYDEALAILRPLAWGREVDGSVLFQIGLAATGASQQPGLADDQRKALLDEAIGAFRTMLIDRPGLVRVRLELALALFLKGENDLSRRHFEHVLAVNPPAPDYDALGARAEAGHRFTRRVTANAQVSWHDRRYRTRALLDRPVMDLSLGGTWVVAPTVRAGSAVPAVFAGSRNRGRHMAPASRRKWPRDGCPALRTELPGGVRTDARPFGNPCAAWVAAAVTCAARSTAPFRRCGRPGRGRYRARSPGWWRSGAAGAARARAPSRSA